MTRSHRQVVKSLRPKPRPVLAGASLVAAIGLHLAIFAGQSSALDAGDPPSGTVPNPSSSRNDTDDLKERRQTLLGETRYARAKLEAAQKQFALQVATAGTSVGNLEYLIQEREDWQARYTSAMAQLDEVDKELAGAEASSKESSKPIVPGENLEVFVNEDPSFNGIYPVRRGGYIIMPQVGRIAVAGKSLSAAEAAVKRALQSSQLHNASVMIERKQGANIDNGPLIYLHGEFREPRPWHIPSGITPTLVNVILSSGGVSDRADLTRVRVMRSAANKSVVEVVNVAKILEGDGLKSDITLGEGDVITIPTLVQGHAPHLFETYPAAPAVPPHNGRHSDYLQEILDKFRPVDRP